MFLVDLCKLTWRENLKGQILWIGFGAGVLVLLLAGALSSVAMDHQDRLLDVSSYFLVDAVALLTALFLGASLFPRDFCNRGLAELLVPRGVSRARLFLGRLVGHGTLLVGLTLFLFAFRAIPVFLSESRLGAFGTTALVMAGFSSLKAILAVCVAAFFGVWVRPVLALLASLGLFLLGHFSSGVSGLRGLVESPDAPVSPFLTFLLGVFRIWNPNFLVLESWRGAWESPGAQELLMRVGWGAAAIAVFATLGALAASAREIGASRAG